MRAADKTWEGVIFDFNGTLFFDNDKHIGAWGEISKELRGRGIDEQELYQHINGVPNEKVIEYLSGKSGDDRTWTEKYSRKKEAIYRRLCKEDKEKFHLVAGVIPYFEALKEKEIPFTIASASIKENIDFFVREFELDRWMDPGKIVYDNGSYSSKKQMFLDAARILQVEPSKILIFEDAISGIKNAWEAGFEHIVVICKKEEEEEYKKLPGVLETIQDFRGWKFPKE